MRAARSRRWLLCTVVAVVPGNVVLASAQQPPARVIAPPSAADSALDARTTEAASRLRCPVCQGESIQDSPSELAQQMRALVREQIKAGKSPAEIDAYFVARYGEWILLEPAPSGFNLLLYAAPVALVLGGLALIVVVVRRWTSQPTLSTDA